jgi:hypothetical protein
MKQSAPLNALRALAPVPAHLPPRGKDEVATEPESPLTPNPRGRRCARRKSREAEEHHRPGRGLGHYEGDEVKAVRVPPTGPPVAKSDELAVGPACADALIAKKTMLPNRVLVTSVILSLHVIDKQIADACWRYYNLRSFHDRELTINFLLCLNFTDGA